MAWHALSQKEIIKKLKTNPKEGLSESEARKRIRKFGPNKLPEKKLLAKTKILLEQFKSPLIYILLIAGIVTLFLKDFADSIIIFIAVGLNAAVGFIQENKASQVLTFLKKAVKVKAIAIREGKQKEIPQEELVPGDVFLLRSGGKVPADGRIMEAYNLKVNESALTGEWLASEKKVGALNKETPLADRHNMIYAGTAIEDGQGKAVVTETGVKTEIGKIVQELQEIREEKTPYQKKLANFSKIIGAVIISISLLIFLWGLFAGKGFIEIFTVSVAMAVAAIPEGLPMAMTVILALGMQRILKKKGLVRKLASAETLGSTSVIITDKTGTLTEAKMTVSGIFTGTSELFGKNYEDLKNVNGDDQSSHITALKIATLCNDAFIENFDKPMEKWVVRGKPTEQALLLAGVYAGLSKRELEEKEPRVDRLPFDPVHKYSATLHKTGGLENTAYIMGAPEVILKNSRSLKTDGTQEPLSRDKLEELRKKNEALTSQGLRVIAVAYKKTREDKLKNHFIKDLVFVGLISMHDPLRKEARSAIQTCREAGIKPIIATGDHKLTTKALASKLGFNIKDKNILDGKDLEKMSDNELGQRLDDIEIYARVEPTQKLRIVKAWQARGEVVAMTGDGVNDAPALKQADVGVALGSGTDVAREVSDLVLLGDSFSVIKTAIEEGRSILDNIRKVITYLFSDTFSEIVLVGTSIILGFPLPITAAQILWVNLVEDGFLNIALAFEPKEKDLMKQKPASHGTPLLNSEMKFIIFIIGLATNLILLTVFFCLFRQNYNLDYIRTMIFVLLGFDSISYVFSCKSLRKNIWHINIFSNKFLVYTWLLGLTALVAAVYLPPLNFLLKTVPLSLSDWWIIIGLGIVNLTLIESSKWYYIHKKNKNSRGSSRIAHRV